jgi:hypothetical protein
LADFAFSPVSMQAGGCVAASIKWSAEGGDHFVVLPSAVR